MICVLAGRRASQPSLDNTSPLGYSYKRGRIAQEQGSEARGAEKGVIFRWNKANKLVIINHLIQKPNKNKPNFHPFLTPFRPLHDNTNPPQADPGRLAS